MRIRTKLGLGFVAMAVLITVTGYVTVSVAGRALEDRIGESSALLAAEVMAQVDHRIQSRIEQMRTVALTYAVREACRDSNRQFSRMEDVESFIRQTDNRWVTAPADTQTAMMQHLLQTPLSRQFREMVDLYRREYGYAVLGEMFLTNRYGALVALSSRTTDYRQDNEQWWQIAREEGRHVTRVAFDESSQVFSTDVAVRVEEPDGSLLGVLKAVVNIEEAIDAVRAVQEIYADGTRWPAEYLLLNVDGRVIYSNAPFERFEERTHLLPQNALHADPVPPAGVFHYTNPQGEEFLVGYARSTGYRDFRGLDWTLVDMHPIDLIYEPIRSLRRMQWTVSLAVAAGGVVFGLWVASSIARRLRRLVEGTRIIGKGNFSHEVGTGVKDEIGELSRAFDQMAENLHATTASRDELDQEVQERKRAEDALRHREHELEAALDQLEVELQTVADLQAHLLPASLPEIPGFQVSAFYECGRIAGGDYYDFFPLGDGRWGLLVADVSGRGARAAVIMAMTRVIVHGMDEKRVPCSVLATLNRELHMNLPGGQFVTAAYGVLDPAERRYLYAAAAHPPPLLVRADGTARYLETPPAAALGILQETTCAENSTSLAAGDHLVFYTDGVTEARSPGGEEFGEERLRRAACQHASATADQMRRAIVDAVAQHTGEAVFHDDVTLLVLRVTGQQ